MPHNEPEAGAGLKRPGRSVAFRLEAAGPAPFDRRLVLDGPEGGWIVLSYRTDPLRPPLRPVLRILRRDGATQDFVLPGGPRAHWLGLLPADTAEIRLAAPDGFVLDRVGRRGEADILLDGLARRPLRTVSALYDRARGDARRYRDTLRGACAVTAPAGIRGWAAARPLPDAADAAAVPVRILLPVRAGQGAALGRTLASLARQTHAGWSTRLVLDAGVAPPQGLDARVTVSAAEGACLADAEPGAALGVLLPGDELAPRALALLAAGLGDAALVYADEIRAGLPRLKPDWSPDLALAAGYLGRPWLAGPALHPALRGLPLAPLSGLAARIDAALAACAGAVRHLPCLLAETVEDAAEDARAEAVGRHLGAAAGAAWIRQGAAMDLLWPLPEPPPLVSVVIPSRDRLDLIAQVCRGVLRETDYPAIELVVVDNGSTDPAVLAHYAELRADPRVKILADPQPFNFSRLVNAGVAASRGAVVVLLNNDIAVLEPGWLTALVRQACRPEVGAVGAKLLYADGRLQHGGVVVGLGGRAGHILRRRPGDAPGHLGQMRVAHEVSAVTAACLAVARAKYDAVGGFDADAFPIDFNDVDFCLRLGALGHKSVWTPHAKLAHLESVSRGPALGAARLRFEAEGARFFERWSAVIRHDPFYHPCLSLTTFGEELE